MSLIANFSATPLTGLPPLTVTFSDTSTDLPVIGDTWEQVILPSPDDVSQAWYGIAISRNTGQYQLAVGVNLTLPRKAFVYRSEDYGVTWTKINIGTNGLPIFLYYWGCGMSSDGAYQYITDGTSAGVAGKIWRSNDKGLTWASLISTPLKLWKFISVSPTGQFVLAVANNPGTDGIWYSNNYGLEGSWHAGVKANNSHFGNIAFLGCTIVPNTPLIQYACGDTNSVYKSTDGGVHWSPVSSLPVSQRYNIIATSDDGMYITVTTHNSTPHVAGNGLVYTSNNAGTSFTSAHSGITSGEQWLGSSMSSDGSKQFVFKRGATPVLDTLYVSTTSGTSFTSAANYPVMYWGGISVTSAADIVVGVGLQLGSLPTFSPIMTSYSALWDWKYGEGSPDIRKETTSPIFHTYNTPGIYQVELTVDNNQTSTPQNIYVDGGVISVDFNGSPVEGNSPLKVSFSADVVINPNQSNFQVSAYSWCFDKENFPGSIVTTSEPIIEHTYTGTYGRQFDVSLSAILYGADIALISGDTSAIKQNYITLGGVEPIRYTHNRDLSLTRFLPSKFADSDMYSFTKVFEDYLNNIFIGNDGVTVSADTNYIDFSSDAIRTSATDNKWAAGALSETGINQIAVAGLFTSAGGFVSKSDDYGVTWNQQTDTNNLINAAPRIYSDVYMSSHGTFRTITVSGGDVYRTANSGTSWTTIDHSQYIVSGNFVAVDGVANGSTQYIMAQQVPIDNINYTSGGCWIFRSDDYGVTWPITFKDLLQAVNGNDIAVSDTGKYVTIIASGDGIYWSNNSDAVTDIVNSVTFNAIASGDADNPNNPNYQPWSKIAMSKDGAYQTVVTTDGGIWRCKSDVDISGNFAPLHWRHVFQSPLSGSGAYFSDITMSSDGRIQCASLVDGVNNYLYFSIDYGLIWNPKVNTNISIPWTMVSMSRNGRVMLGAISDDDDFLYEFYNNNAEEFFLPTDDLGTISILEKSQRLTELQDPDLIDIENIQFLASNLGYNINVNRGEVGGFGTSYGTPDAKTSALAEGDQNRYLRFMTSNLPDIYKIKTTDSDIQVMLYSFGLVGDLIKYYTDNYKSTIDGGKWIADYSKTLHEIPNTFFPTPHFSIVIEIDSSDDLSKDAQKRSAVINAVESLRPANTVFRKLAAHANRTLTNYVSMKTRFVRYIRIPKSEAEATPTLSDFAPHNLPANSSSINGPLQTVSASTENIAFPIFPAYKAFDGGASPIGNQYWVANTNTGWLEIDLGVGNSHTLYNYSVQVNTVPEPNRAPRDWTMEGSNDNSIWNTLSTVTSQTSWGSGEIRNFSCSIINTAYRYFRINVSANNGDTYLEIAEMYLFGV